jgi:hypothetical protein
VGLAAAGIHKSVVLAGSLQNGLANVLDTIKTVTAHKKSTFSIVLRAAGALIEGVTGRFGSRPNIN